LKNYLDLEDLKKIIFRINENIRKNIEYLSKLDSVIGDGDHGITISSGFRNTAEKISEKDFNSISEFLKFVGNNFISAVGGTTGPIFGYLFSEMGKTAEGLAEKISADDLCLMFTDSLNKIMKIGGAKPGDKTMVDALYPAINSLKESISQKLSLKDSLELMLEAAKKGAESTKEMVAVKGRARYLGERSLGYQDAGATSVYIIIGTFFEILNEQQ
jgi:dihydroxyacetone kinase-like protein